MVQENKDPQHVLITRGIYQYIRHPGYLGFYIFAVGTQIALKNPIAVVVYIVVLWKFFHDRIDAEEYYLVQMFGNEYKLYRGRTPTWIPFIK
jgi:protein-S-isoprenylcysteine O-methyltransferase